MALRIPSFPRRRWLGALPCESLSLDRSALLLFPQLVSMAIPTTMLTPVCTRAFPSTLFHTFLVCCNSRGYILLDIVVIESIVAAVEAGISEGLGTRHRFQDFGRCNDDTSLQINLCIGSIRDALHFSKLFVRNIAAQVLLCRSIGPTLIFRHGEGKNISLRSTNLFPTVLSKSYPSLIQVLPKAYPRCTQGVAKVKRLAYAWVVLGYYLDRVWVERRNMSVRNIKTYIVTKLTVPKIDLDSSTLTFLQCHTIVLVQPERLLVLLNYRTQLIGRRMTDEGLHSCQCTASCSFSVN